MKRGPSTRHAAREHSRRTRPSANATFTFAAAIPVRDGLPDILDAVESALTQSRPPVEIVVADDGSRDGTPEALAERFGDRVRVLRGPFGGAAAARNAAWRASRAPWVAFLDADDLWFPDKLATAARALAASPAACWFFSDGAFRTIDGTLEPSWLAPWADLDEPYDGSPVAELFEVNFILTSSMVASRAALEASGGFDETLSHAEDLDLWIRLARRWPAAATARPLVRYQHRPAGLTAQLERRLLGDVTLFSRLARDRDLSPALRRRAQRRAALARYKLAVDALRGGRGGEARTHLRGAWLFPGRATAVALAWAASFLPAPLMARLRRAPWATRGVASRLVRQRRVTLRSESQRLTSATAGGRS